MNILQFTRKSMFLILLMLLVRSNPTIAVMKTASNHDYTIGNENLLDAINAALHNMIVNREYDTIFRNWFGDVVFIDNDTTFSTSFQFPARGTLDNNGTLLNIITNGQIIWGSDTTFPPFETLVDGEVVGFDVDIGKEIAKELSMAYGVTITSVMQTNDWGPIIPDLKAGSFDAILSAMTKTESRAEEIDFTRAYFTYKEAVLARDDSPVITEVNDLNKTGVKIGVISTTASDIYIQNNLQKANKSGFTFMSDAVLALVYGEIDYFLGNLPSLGQYAVNNPSENLSVVTVFGENENFGIGVRKDTGTVVEISTTTDPTTSEEGTTTTKEDTTSLSENSATTEITSPISQGVPSISNPLPFPLIFVNMIFVTLVVVIKRKDC